MIVVLALALVACLALPPWPAIPLGAVLCAALACRVIR